MDQVRCVLTESARIARTAVQPLDKLVPAGFSGIVFPGGFGAAKNLSDFGFKGADMTVHKDVERVLKDFHSAGKLPRIESFFLFSFMFAKIKMFNNFHWR
jgi:enhancing lycopene biosynthesis protein 2